MAAQLPILSGVIQEPIVLAVAVIVVCLIAIVALTAVFSKKETRREMALEVLRVLVRDRGRDRGSSERPTDDRPIRGRRDPPDLPPPNP